MNKLFPDDVDDPLLSPGYYQESAAMRAGPTSPPGEAIIGEVIIDGRHRYDIYVICKGYVVTNWFGKLIKFTYGKERSTWCSKRRAINWIKRHKYST